ncbi:MAG: quinone oxidoreductase family protein [Acidimicrobiia bacterium]
MHAIQISEVGGPEVLTWTEAPSPIPGQEEVVVRLTAAGLNFVDTYYRTGLYPASLPFVPGQEGAGTVELLGAGVKGWAIGDRVAWTDVGASYAERVAVPVSRMVRIPDDIDLDIAAAVMLQGITAHYLATDTFALGPGHRCLIHAGAGGVGQLLIQIAKLLGAEVVATAGGDDKVALAHAAGADHVIDYTKIGFVEAVEALVGKRAIDVVYDGVGAATFEGGLQLLRRRGLMVAFGNASGPVPPVSPLRLAQGGSLFLTRPTITDYIATRVELESRVSDLFEWIDEGQLQVRVGARFALAEAADAHRALEARATTGKVLLVP